MFLEASGASGAEAIQVVRAYLLLHVGHLALLAQFAEPEVKIRAIFCAAISGWNYVSVNAFVAFLAMAILQKEAAGRNSVFLILVQVLAVAAFLALPFEPVDANNLLVLRLVNLAFLAFVQSYDLVKRKEVIHFWYLDLVTPLNLHTNMHT